MNNNDRRTRNELLNRKAYFPSEYSPVNAQTSKGLNAFLQRKMIPCNVPLQCAISLQHVLLSVAFYKVKQH